MTALTLLTALSTTILAGAKPIPPALTLVSRSFDAGDLYANWPSYDDLPLHPSFPTKAAWGVWGSTDEFGALNHITNATILAAKSEIKEGRAFNLNLELNIPDPPLNPTRPALVHSIQPFAGYQDDILTLNTQISTQFDGLRHYPYSTDNNQSTYQFYNDLITFDDIVAPGGTKTLGIQNSAQKGIAGRGVLLDWGAWKVSKNESYDAFSAIAIPTTDLDAVAAWQGIPANFTAPGDFLAVRTGFTQQYLALSPYEQSILPFRTDTEWIGVEASDATLRWLWEKKLALVGSDNPAFEPVPFNATIDGVPDRALHQVFIGGWGQSIVEFLDLEALATACHELKRYHFFFTIQNLNVVGGIASPPNAMAIL